MKVEMRDITEINPDNRNSRIHSDEQITQLTNSIREFGFTNPIIIDEDNSVLAGHGRLRAATRAGMTEVPTLKLIGLSDVQKRAYIITDNKIGLNAEWDDELLQSELRELFNKEFDLASLGWNEREMLSFVGDPLEGTDIEKDFVGAEEITFDDIDDFSHRCPRCGFEFNG